MEMSRWWERFTLDFEAFDEVNQQRIEDLTGCIPLLLESFLQHSGDFLEPQIWDEDVLQSAGRNLFDFAVGFQDSRHFRP